MKRPWQALTDSDPDDWSRRQKVLVFLGLGLVSFLTGWVWVVVFDHPAGVVDGSSFGHFLPLTFLGGFLLVSGIIGAYIAAYALMAVVALVLAVLRAPIRIGRWVASNGLRGLAGHGVRLVAIGIGVSPLFLLARLTGVGALDLAAISVIIGLSAFMGGMLGAGAVAAIGFVVSLFSSKLGKLAEKWILVGAAPGMLAGAYANRDELLTIPLAASPAGAWAVILVSLTYMAGVRLLYRSVREVRIRARLFPVIGRPSPDPAEAFWSPVPVLAWRAWMPAKRGLLGAWGTVWRRPELHARCAKGTHLAPDWNCDCGIYGLKVPPSPQVDQVVGLVELSGKVIEHEDGYRAEHAAIKRFWLHPGARGTTHHRMLSERFGNVPIELGQPDARYSQQETPWEQ